MRLTQEIQVVAMERQRVWHWPAVINFMLGGAGAGFYIFAALVGDAARAWLGPVLVGVGLAVLALEAGRPFRAHHLLRNLGQSWMSREVLAAMIFVATASLDVYRPSMALTVVAVISALVLVLCHGLIIYRARAIPSWNVPVMPVLVISSGLTAGAGVALLVLPHLMAAAGLACVVVDLAAWLAYLRWTHEPAFWRATQTLRGRGSLLMTVGVGHLLPGALLALLLANPHTGYASFVAGAAMIVGSLSQKAEIILRAGYLRTIALLLPEGVRLGVSV
jgi:DMSO reductase anchor subunit